MVKALLAGLLISALGASESAVAQRALPPAAAALAAYLQRNTEGFASASAPWRFRFPADHGAHPAYRTEFWRFSGSVATDEGRRFGVQLTFLRIGINPPATPLGPSAWAARDLYWAQFAVADAEGDRRYDFDRLARAAMQMSGAERSPSRVWVHDWTMEVRHAEAGEASFDLRAAQDEVDMRLSLRAVKPAVTRTASQAQPNEAVAPNAFHAYLVTRLTARGSIRIGQRVSDVEGVAWLDRAWGEVPLPVGAVVWDRFMLQLDDGREVMAVRLRRRDGRGEAVATGLLVERDGSARTLEATELAIDAVDRRWRLRMPGQHLELYLDPYVAAHDKLESLQLWQAVRISGTAQGHGHVEGADYIAAGSRP